MSAGLLGIPWPTIIAGGIALLLVGIIGAGLRSILKGDLVPRQHLVDVRADRDKWEAAWRTQQATIAEFDGQLAANTEALRLMQQFVEALAVKGQAR